MYLLSGNSIRKPKLMEVDKKDEQGFTSQENQRLAPLKKEFKIFIEYFLD